MYVVVLLVNYFRRSDRWTVYKPNPDWRTVAAYLARELDSSPTPFATFVTVPSTECAYYEPRLIPGDLLAQQEYRRRSSGIPPKPPTADLKKKLRDQIWTHYEEHALRVSGAVVHQLDRPDVAFLKNAVKRSGAPVFYVVRNTMWRGCVDELLSALRSDPQIRPLGRFEAKGLRVFRYELIAGR